MDNQDNEHRLKRHMALLVTDQQVTDNVEVKDEPEVDEAQYASQSTDMNDPLMMEPKSEPSDDDTDDETTKNQKPKTNNNDINVDDKILLKVPNTKKSIRVLAVPKNIIPANGQFEVLFNDKKKQNVKMQMVMKANNNLTKIAPNSIASENKVVLLNKAPAGQSAKTYRAPNIIKPNQHFIMKANTASDVITKSAKPITNPSIINKVLNSLKVPKGYKISVVGLSNNNHNEIATTPFKLKESPKKLGPTLTVERVRSAQPCISSVNSIASTASTNSIDLTKEDSIIPSGYQAYPKRPVVTKNTKVPTPPCRILKGSTPDPIHEIKKPIRKKYVLAPKHLVEQKEKGVTSGIIMCSAEQIKSIDPKSIVASYSRGTKSNAGLKSALLTLDSKIDLTANDHYTVKSNKNDEKEKGTDCDATQSITVGQDSQPILATVENMPAENDTENPPQDKSLAELLEEIQSDSNDVLANSISINDNVEDDDDYDPFTLSPLPPPDTTDYTPEGPFLDEASGTFLTEASGTFLTEASGATSMPQSASEAATTRDVTSKENTSKKSKPKTLDSLFSEMLENNRVFESKGKYNKKTKVVKKFTAEDLVKEFKKVQAQNALKAQKAQQPDQKLKDLKRKVSKSQRAVFDELTVDMHPVAKKIFWTQIISGRNKNGTVHRFSHEEKVLFAAIQTLSQPCHSILEKIFVMPSSKSLEQYNKSLSKENPTTISQQPGLNRSEYQPEEWANQQALFEEFQEENPLPSRSFLETALDDIVGGKLPTKRNAVDTPKPETKPPKQRKKKVVDETLLAVASISEHQQQRTVNQSAESQDIAFHEQVYSTTDRVYGQLPTGNRLADASDIWIMHAQPKSGQHTDEYNNLLESSKALNVPKKKKVTRKTGYADEFGKYLNKKVIIKSRSLPMI